MPSRPRPSASPFVNPFTGAGRPSYLAHSSDRHTQARRTEKKAEVTRPQPVPRRLTPIRETSSSLSSPSASCGYEPGDTVLHSIFGNGTVTKIEGSGDSTKATIEFDTHGTKQLLIKFARLKKL